MLHLERDPEPPPPLNKAVAQASPERRAMAEN